MVRIVSKGFDADEFESHGSTWQLQKTKSKKIQKINKIEPKQIKREKKKKEREMKIYLRCHRKDLLG